jgi:ketosteroid isomerase-like protein
MPVIVCLARDKTHPNQEGRMRLGLTLFSFVLPVIGGALIMAPPSRVASHAAPPDRAQLEQVLAAWASKDLTQPARFYAHDPNLVFYDIAPLKYTGWADYEKGTSEMFKTVKSLTFTLRDDAQIHKEDDITWATATVGLDMVSNDGSNMKLDARWTSIWEERNDKWVIVHDHFSAPLPEPKP